MSNKTDNPKIKTMAQLLFLIGETENAYYLIQTHKLDKNILKEEIKMSREDLLHDIETPEMFSTNFFALQNFWRNFDKIIDVLSENNQQIDIPFLLEKNLSASTTNVKKSIVDYAMTADSAKKLLSPELWIGRMEDAMSLFFHFSVNQRKEMSLNLICEEICKKEGKPFRRKMIKDALNKGNDFLSVIRQGNVDDYLNTIKSLDLLPEPSDIFLADESNGDTIFYSTNNFSHFATWVNTFHDHGKKIDVTLLTRKYGSQMSFIEKAVQQNALGYIFDQDIWIKRLSDVQYLWDHVPEDKRNDFDFDEFYEELKEISYDFDLKIDNTLTKESLFTICQNDETKPPAISLVGFWENFVSIQAILKRQNNPVTIKDLYQSADNTEENILCKALRYGYLEEALSLLSSEKGVYLDFDECTKEDQKGNSFLSLICAKFQVEALFNPDLWVGNPKLMEKFWDAIPAGEGDKENTVDFAKILSEVNLRTLRMVKRKSLYLRPS